MSVPPQDDNKNPPDRSALHLRQQIAIEQLQYNNKKLSERIAVIEESFKKAAEKQLYAEAFEAGKTQGVTKVLKWLDYASRFIGVAVVISLLSTAGASVGMWEQAAKILKVLVK